MNAYAAIALNRRTGEPYLFDSSSSIGEFAVACSDGSLFAPETPAQWIAGTALLMLGEQLTDN